jgi:hypothetical protein
MVDIKRRGQAGPELLATYQTERHPVGRFAAHQSLTGPGAAELSEGVKSGLRPEDDLPFLLFDLFWGVLGIFQCCVSGWHFSGHLFSPCGLVTFAFLAMGGLLLCEVRALPKEPYPEDGARGRSIVRGFGIIFGLEIVLIALASTLLSIFPLSRFIAPTTALIVGIHFIPLARLFRINVGYVTGTLLCVLALIALVALLVGVPLAGSSPYHWSLFVGIGATLVLWLTDLFMMRFGWKSIPRREEGN